MAFQKILLTKDDIELINENFGLELNYSDAEHYRAAHVIWNLWKPDEESNDVTM